MHWKRNNSLWLAGLQIGNITTWMLQWMQQCKLAIKYTNDYKTNNWENNAKNKKFQYRVIANHSYGYDFRSTRKLSCYRRTIYTRYNIFTISIIYKTICWIYLYCWSKRLCAYIGMVWNKLQTKRNCTISFSKPVFFTDNLYFFCNRWRYWDKQIEYNVLVLAIQKRLLVCLGISCAIHYGTNAECFCWKERQTDTEKIFTPVFYCTDYCVNIYDCWFLQSRLWSIIIYWAISFGKIFQTIQRK